MIICLEQNDLPLEVILPTGIPYPNHFHITEIGNVQKTFVDCGGTKRQINSCLLQVWVANDYEHRLKSFKLAEIMNMAKTTIVINNEEVEIELERNGTIAQYRLENIEIIDNFMSLRLGNKKTDCLAPDKCGIKTNCCGTNCC